MGRSCQAMTFRERARRQANHNGTNEAHPMEGRAGVVTDRGGAIRRPDPQGNGTRTGVHGRVRVDGKFLARGRQRLRVQGVTYGPFAPGADGVPFPALETVDEDFARIRAAGINALRTYHVPPEWFLIRTDEKAIDVFADVPWRKHLCFLDSLEAQ